MKDEILYPYILVILFFSFISELHLSRGSGSYLVALVFLSTFVTLAFNPISWAVYYVSFNRRAYFRHLDLLIGYEAFLVIISLIIPGIFHTILPFALTFFLLNFANPISWVIILISVDRGAVVRKAYRPGAPRPPGAPNPMTASAMASPARNSQGFGDNSAQVNNAAMPNMGQSQATVQAPSGIVQQRPAPTRYQPPSAFGDDVTLVGYVGGGKTTFTALFVYACQFIKGIPNFRFVLEESSPVVRSGLGQLLSGEWPSLTLRSEFRTRTRIVLSRKKGLSTRKVNLTINDVSGEIWREVAEHAENPGPRLSQLVRENPSVISLQRAAKYMITVDCSDFGKWDSEQLYILDLFRAIRAINGGKKIRKPAAVIFTKLDLLPPQVQDKDPEALMREHLPYVYSYLEEHYDSRTFNFFKVGVRVNEFNKPDVTLQDGKKKLTVIGGGSMGSFPEIVRWMLSD